MHFYCKMPSWGPEEMGRARRSGCREHGEGKNGTGRIIPISLVLVEDDGPESEQPAPGFALAPASAVVFTVCLFMDGLMLIVHVILLRLSVVMEIEGHQ